MTRLALLASASLALLSGCPRGPTYVEPDADVSSTDAGGDGGIDGEIDGGIDANPIDAPEPDANPAVCGLRIAFQVGPEGSREIWVADLDGGGAVNVSNSSADDINPTWSPDGGRLAFQSNRNGNWDIIVANADGTGLVNVTMGVTLNDERPAWSPDGARIAFVRNLDVAFMNPTGGGLFTVPTENVVNVLKWSPAGDRVVFGGNDGGSPDLFVVEDQAGATPVNVSSPGASIAGSASWTPSARIVFDGYAASGKDIFTVAADGSVFDNVTEDSATDHAPVWTPDGSTIVYTSTHQGRYSIHAIAATGGSRTLVRDSGLSGTGSGEWVRDVSADGQWVVFERAMSSTAADIGVVRLDGTGFDSFNVGNSTNARAPRFSPCL